MRKKLVDPYSNGTILSILAMPLFFFGIGLLLFYGQVFGHWHGTSRGADYFLKGLVIIFYVAQSLGLVFLLHYFITRTWLEIYDLKSFFFQLLSSVNQQRLRRFKFLMGLLLSLIVVNLLLQLFSALKPAHLIQESDFVNYHWLLPKQHWLNKNWRPIEFSVFEFRHLVIQYGLSFYWQAFALLNKLEHFFLNSYGLLTLWSVFSLLSLERSFIKGAMAVGSLLAFRAVSIQMGTAMLDFSVVYFLLLVVASWIYFIQNQTNSWRVSAIWAVSMASYLGHKSFGFIYALALIGLVSVTVGGFYKVNILKKLQWRSVLSLVLALAVIYFPTAYRAFYYTGDFFYPVLPQASKTFCQDSHLQAISCRVIYQTAENLVKIKDQYYGFGHDIGSLVKTLLLIGVADQSKVNNAFDYPLGFFYYFTLLMLLLLAVMFSKIRKSLAFLGLTALGFFLVWFMGSQQSRWLYPMLVILSVALGYGFGKQSGKLHNITLVFLVGLIFSLTLNSGRILRAQRQSLGCWGESCLQTNQRYWLDYQKACDGEITLKASELADRGYLNCRLKVESD